MPPKKKAGGREPAISKKSEAKFKEKVIEDKTFGLKNKNKSARVQKYVAEVTKQVKGTNARAERLKQEEMKKKKDAKQQQEVLQSLFAASITQPKVRTGLPHEEEFCMLITLLM